MNDLIIDPIDHALNEQLLMIQRHKANWAFSRRHFIEIDRQVRLMDIEPRIGCGGDWYVIETTGDAAKLRAILDLIIAAGFTTTEGKPKPGATVWNPLFGHPVSKVKLYLVFTSNVCKRIKVGTKTVEQDVYETICTDFTAIEDAPAPQLEELESLL